VILYASEALARHLALVLGLLERVRAISILRASRFIDPRIRAATVSRVLIFRSTRRVFASALSSSSRVSARATSAEPAIATATTRQPVANRTARPPTTAIDVIFSIPHASRCVDASGEYRHMAFEPSPASRGGPHPRRGRSGQG
jgi:hypothetical protein